MSAAALLALLGGGAQGYAEGRRRERLDAAAAAERAAQAERQQRIDARADEDQVAQRAIQALSYDTALRDGGMVPVAQADQAIDVGNAALRSLVGVGALRRPESTTLPTLTGGSAEFVHDPTRTKEARVAQAREAERVAAGERSAAQRAADLLARTGAQRDIEGVRHKNRMTEIGHAASLRPQPKTADPEAFKKRTIGQLFMRFSQPYIDPTTRIRVTPKPEDAQRKALEAWQQLESMFGIDGVTDFLEGGQIPDDPSLEDEGDLRL